MPHQPFTRVRVAIALLVALSLGGVLVGLAQVNQDGDGVWEIVAERPAGLPARATIIGRSALVRLNKVTFDARTSLAPLDRNLAASNAVILPLPGSDGTFGRFRVANSPILSPELAVAYPEFQTYIGQGIDDPTATARFGWTGTGFHAIVLSASGTTYIDPYATGNVELYTVVDKEGIQRPDLPFFCPLPGADTAARSVNEFPITNGTSLRTYRLALAATGEYTMLAGGTKQAALSRMVATINRVDGIYERELAVRFTLSTGTPGDATALIYTSAVDPYTNGDDFAMIAENQTNIDAVVGNANYDFGHVFGTGNSGLASLGSTCATGFKARGVTGSNNPVGDAFDVDYVSHEMGHQFGGDHTFNGTSSACGPSREGAHAAEVGSGSTIQAYAGICAGENLQLNSDDYFTFESLNQMTAFITSEGGATCGVATATGNTVPVVNAGASYTIPVSTPFTLTAAASDANGDALTYDWEQWSLNGASTTSATASTDLGSNPILRSFSPTTSPSRTFPKLTYILNNANAPPPTYTCSGLTCLTGEVLPTTSRAIPFHVTVRDNRANGGAIATGMVTVTSSTTAGPFRVTSPNTSISVTGGTAATITWDVANTSAAPVSAANVKISLSTDGGTTFPTILAASTPNDGTQSVTMANVTTAQARVKVEAVGNIFFDVSNANFTITAAPAFIFTDDPLSTGNTPVKAIHVTELRQAVNTVRAQVGLSPFAWTDATITVGVTQVKAVHLAELRTALNAAYTMAGRTPPTYTQSTLTSGSTVIKAVDIAELRTAVSALR